VFGAPCHDALRQCGPDPRQTCDFAHVRAIEVDALAGEEGTGELSGTTGSLAQAGAAGGSGGLELDIAGGSAGGGRKDETDPGASQC
jgi:hypothetical protein